MLSFIHPIFSETMLWPCNWRDHVIEQPWVHRDQRIFEETNSDSGKTQPYPRTTTYVTLFDGGHVQALRYNACFRIFVDQQNLAITTSKLIDFGVLDHILLTCKRATDTPITLRHAALALANLALYSNSETKKKIIQKKLPDWLFLLASQVLSILICNC